MRKKKASRPSESRRTTAQVVHDYLAGRPWRELVARARAGALIRPLPLGPGGMVCLCDPWAPEQCPHRAPADVQPPSKMDLFIAHVEQLVWDAARRATDPEIRWDAARRGPDPEILRHARRLQEVNRGTARRAERPPVYPSMLVALAHAGLAREVQNPTWVYAELAKELGVGERTIRRLVTEGRKDWARLLKGSRGDA